MHELVEFLTKFDLHTLLPLGILTWALNRNLKQDIDKRIEEIKRDNAASMNEIHKEFKFINIRLSRVEGAVYGKDLYKVEDSNKG